MFTILGHPTFETTFSFIPSLYSITQCNSNTYIFLHDGALFTVIRIRNALSTANDAASLEGAIVTFVANMDQSTGSHVSIANNTLSITYTLTYRTIEYNYCRDDQ